MQPPSNYISTRITVPHCRLPEVLEAFKDCSWYICYPHFGKQGDNEHFHIACPDANPKRFTELKARIRDAFGSGNAVTSSKRNQNGILQAIQYFAKEGTSPTTHGDSVGRWIADAPVWVNQDNLSKKRKRAVLEDPITGEQFTMKTCLVKQNLVSYMSHFWKRKCKEDPDYPKDGSAFKRTIIDMMATGKYLYQIRDMALECFRMEFHVEIQIPNWELEFNDFDYHCHEMTIKKMRHDLVEKQNILEMSRINKEMAEVDRKLATSSVFK